MGGGPGAPPPPPPPAPPLGPGASKLKLAGSVVMAANTWGEKRSKPMNTLNWEKLPTFKANKTIWGQQGAGSATSSLLDFLGTGKEVLDLDVTRLEEMFAKPEVKERTPRAADAEFTPRKMAISLLDAKRSTSVGIVMKRITDTLGGKDLRDALMEVDENVLPLEVLPMVMEIVPNAEERTKLQEYAGEDASLDKPERMLRTLSYIPRLEGRLRAMKFKAQLEADMDAILMQQVDDLQVACKLVAESKELHALMQVVLDVGNALNAGTSKGNAVGFKLSTLLKLAELKALDKKTTLLHFVVEVVHNSAPGIMKVIQMQKAVRDATRVSLDELAAKKLEAERGLAHVDTEITWHDEQRLRGGDAAEEDQFPEVFTEFYNWAAERKEHFDLELAKAQDLFRAAAELMGEGDAKEPSDLFDYLEKFIRRFEAVTKEVDEEKRTAEETKRAAANKGFAKKTLKSGQRMAAAMGGNKSNKITIKPKQAVPGQAVSSAVPSRDLAGYPDDEDIPQKKRASNASSLQMASQITNAGKSATSLFRGFSNKKNTS